MKIHIYDMNNWVRRRVEADKSGFVARNCFNEIHHTDGLPIAVWDGKGSLARRRAIFPGYKVREQAGEDIFELMNLIKEVTTLSRAVNVCCNGWEADDVIATIARSMPSEQVYIHSTDKDFFQLPGVILDDEAKAPCARHWVRLYKTLVGDTSDKIPGLPGFGVQSWKDLVQTHQEVLWQHYIEDYESPHRGMLGSKRTRNWCSNYENWKLLNSYWRIIELYEVPSDELNDGTVLGANDWKAAQDIFERFMI